ncbi:MAG: ABC transporter substrate-binding protein [Candidatus Lokiarchaeota archaeon]|nr:ABC transporter substrate-binding protein [Candidatus Lokiarchaeota archaeon]
MKRIVKRSIIFTLISLVFLVNCTKQNIENQEKIKLRIGRIKVLSGLPLYVAIEEKLFENAGFDVELTTYRSSDLVYEAFRNDQIDLVGIAGSSQCFALIEEKPNLPIILGFNYSSNCLIESKSLNTNMQNCDFSNKTIGVFPGSVFGTYAREALKASGANIDNTTFLPFPPPLQLNALKDGKIDALYTLEPTGAEAVYNNIGRYVTKDDLFSKHFLDNNKFPGGAVVLSSFFIEKHVGSDKKIIEVFNSSMNLINSKNFDSFSYLSKYTDIDSEFIPKVNFEGAEYGKDIPYTSIEKLINLLVKWNLLDSNINIEKNISK